MCNTSIYYKHTTFLEIPLIMKFYYLCTWIRAPSRKSEKCAFTVIEWHNYRPYFGSKFATH